MHTRSRDMTTVSLWKAPLLAAQSVWLRARRPLAPKPHAQDHGTVPGPGRPAFRLAVLGESTAVGASTPHHTGIAEALAAELRDKLGRQVDWTVRRPHGSTVRFIRHHMIPQAANDHDLVVLMAGTSDAIGGESLHDWSIDMAAAIQDLAVRNRHVLVGGIPGLRDYPHLPHPLAEFLDRRAREMDAETARIVAGCDNVTFASSRGICPLEREMFAGTGCT